MARLWVQAVTVVIAQVYNLLLFYYFATVYCPKSFWVTVHLSMTSIGFFSVEISTNSMSDCFLPLISRSFLQMGSYFIFPCAYASKVAAHIILTRKGNSCLTPSFASRWRWLQTKVINAYSGGTNAWYLINFFKFQIGLLRLKFHRYLELY